MTTRGPSQTPYGAPERSASAQTQIREQFSWLPKVLSLAAVPVMALVWWALAFLPWTHQAGPRVVESWPPTLPVLFTDIGAAVFAPIGVSIVVVALVRRGGVAFASVLLGFVVSAWVTLARPPGAPRHSSLAPLCFSSSERNIMLGVCALAALAGLGIGAAAIMSPQLFGFLGLLAVLPVVSLGTDLLLDPPTDNRWMTRLILVALLVMIAWRRWTGVLVWPIFFALLWLLDLTIAAVGYGAQSLHPAGGGPNTVGGAASAMLDFVRSAWRAIFESTWQLFWPGALIAAVVVAGVFVWRLVWLRFRPAPTSPA